MSHLSIPGFVGSSNVLDAKIAGASESINLFVTTTAPDGGKVPAYERNTPGLRPWLSLPTSPVRALFQQDQRAYAIAGNTYYELLTPLTTPTYAAYGTMAVNDYLPTIDSNGSAGSQNFIVSGDLGYIHDLGSNTFTQITDPGFPTRARMGAFTDGYFAVQVTESRQWQISALEDGTTWDPLDIAERSIASDNIAALVRLQRLIALIGTKTSEFWYDSGNPLFPFAPTQGQLLEHGAAAPFTVVRLQDTLFWLGQDEDGIGVVWKLTGNQLQTISSTAMNRLIQASGSGSGNDLRLSVAWTYQQNGQSFYCLNLPNCRWTLVYDLSMGLWHKRSDWNPDAYLDVMWRPQCHMYWPDAGKHLVGDRLTGTIYEMSLDVFDDVLVTP